MADQALTPEQQASERVGLEVALRGVREGLTYMPAGSLWVGCLRELRTSLGAAVEQRHPSRPCLGLAERDDLAA